MSMGILQAVTLEWVAMFSSRGSPQPRDQTQISRIAGGFFTIWAPGKSNIPLSEEWSPKAFVRISFIPLKHSTPTSLEGEAD